MAEILSADQKGEIWRALSKVGLDPRSCHLSTSDLPGYDRQILHQPSNYAIYIASSGRDASYRYHILWHSLNRRGKLTPVSTSTPYWPVAISTIKSWGKEAGRHTISSRPTEFDFGAAARATYANSDNSRFTVAEQRQIASQLHKINESLKQNFKLSKEQMSRVEERLAEAEEASQRLGRKDWILLFSGAVFSLILADVVTPDAAHHVFTIFIHGVGHLFTSGGVQIRGAIHS